MFFTWSSVGAVVKHTHGFLVEKNHSTTSAAVCVLPAPWQLATAVLLLSRTLSSTST